jgi:dCTP deaminase
MSAGVLNSAQVQAEILDGESPALKSDAPVGSLPDASSIDLPLGSVFWELQTSIRPSGLQSVTDVIKQLGATQKPLATNTLLKKNSIYIVELAWSELRLPDGICARGTAKSSIGRLDVLVRLLADRQPQFDRVNLGEATRLYVEIVPLTFDILVSPNTSLSQLRFIRGSDDLCLVSVPELRHENPHVLVYGEDGSSALQDLQDDHYSALLSLDASPDKKLAFSGFRAKKDGALPPVNPSLRAPKNGSTEQRHDPHQYWEPVERHKATQGILIERDRFYILRSKERFRIPAHLCVECQAYSESLGDIRIHYAGFAHPFFGLDRKEGTPLIFEVRGFSLSTILRDGAPLAKVQFRRMSNDADPTKAEKSYNQQELNLSACFRPWA